MNAGAFGGETWDSVESVDTLDRQGRQRTRSRAEYRVGYRSVTGVPGEWFLGATLALSSDPDADMSQTRRDAAPAGPYPAAGRAQLRFGVSAIRRATLPHG